MGARRELLHLIVGAAVLLGGIEMLGKRPAQHRSPAPMGSHGFPRQLEDASGAMRTLAAAPARIVSQTLATDEILLAICPHVRLIGLSPVADDPAYSNVLSRGPDVHAQPVERAEQILQLRPDLVFVASYSRAETVKQLQASGALLVRLSSFDALRDIESNIRVVGHATGCDEAAARLVDTMEADLAAARARIPAGSRPPRVLSLGREGYTAGSETLFDSEVRAAGAVNVAAEHGVRGFARISSEQLALWKPDVVVDGAAPSQLEARRRSLLADPMVRATAARVLVVDGRHLLAASQHSVLAVKDLVDGLYATR